MMPSKLQKQWLQDYLRAVLNYRETYEEVYDHVLLALDNKSADDFFETSVITIIEDDFGGGNGLMKLEGNCKYQAVNDVKKQYLYFLTRWFKLPYLIYSIAVFLFVYIIGVHIKYAFTVYILLFIIILITPVFLLSVRAYKSGYKFDDTKNSLRDSVFRKIAYRPFLYLIYYFYLEMAVGFISHIFHIHYLLPIVLNDIIIVGSLLLSVLHVISFAKLYKQDFKTSLIN